MAARKPHHPPEPGAWLAPAGGDPAPIFGDRAIAGFGERSFYVAVVPRHVACRLVVEHHYSRRVVANSYVHLGVFHAGRLRGVLQWGYALNPSRMSRVVAGTASIDYLELNRMWLSDLCPRNSESRAIGFALAYVRRAMPHVRWVQSFADERCGRLGVVYQASNFLYVGCHDTEFYELDGEWFHKLLVTAKRKGGERGVTIRAGLDRATRHRFRQYRYVRFLHPGARRHLRLAVLPYPKPSAAGQ